MFSKYKLNCLHFINKHGKVLHGLYKYSRQNYRLIQNSLGIISTNCLLYTSDAADDNRLV